MGDMANMASSNVFKIGQDYADEQAAAPSMHKIGDSKEEIIGAKICIMPPPSDWMHGIVNSKLGYLISQGLSNGKCRVFVDCLGVKCPPTQGNKQGDYVQPDVVIACDTSLIEDGFYNGVPKFVAETISKSSIRRDRIDKMRIYAEIGISEYWIMDTRGSVEVYYLEDGRYALHDVHALCEDLDKEKCKAHDEADFITLREFPAVSVCMARLFE